MDPKSLSQQRFGQYAQGYVDSPDHAKSTDLDRLVQIANPQTGWTVLDVATGGGHTALRFASHTRLVVASDLTLAMLWTARQHITSKGAGNILFSAADAEDLPFPAGAFDLVTCRIAPHHFNDCARFVQEAGRTLKSGGLLLVQDHVLPDDPETAGAIETFEKLRDPSHHRAFTEQEWAGMFRQAGLRVTHIERVHQRHQFLPWAERQGCSSEIVERLARMLKQAPPAVLSWMQPQGLDTPELSFANQHVIIAGKK
jgi:ubiquinone/menaquinone biosynthesis C-methylase UbiE